MRFRLVPVDDRFFELFADAAANAYDCALKFRDFIDSPTDDKHAAVKKHEKRGDELTAETLRRLHSSFVTPIGREDVHKLTEDLDDAVDDMFGAADLYHLTKPGTAPSHIRDAADVLVRMAEASKRLVDEMEDMKNIDEQLLHVGELESEGDSLYRQTVAELFSGSYDALDVLRWKDIAESIENAINSFEDISDTVESIVLKHT